MDELTEPERFDNFLLEYRHDEDERWRLIPAWRLSFATFDEALACAMRAVARRRVSVTTRLRVVGLRIENVTPR